MIAAVPCGMGPAPIATVCQACRRKVVTTVIRRRNNMFWLVMVLLYFILGIFVLFFFCCDWMMEMHHICPSCGVLIGVFQM
ncbi:hypothetical protein QR680_013537 [Steinernema hermaphroditum]|uniref:LITAF domain-containing protein n=1 Tax=Steinernema hermaphroditum TaxID=289476 RepID=A0AA39I5V6_9BILA|nr:hypothetical protein QR680_013537 [Steinernema hermaphroditum]